MPKNQFDSPPLVEEKDEFREYMLKLHDDVYGLGQDTVGTLNAADNLEGGSQLIETASATMAGKTKTITFTTEEDDTDYFIALSQNADENFFWSSPTTTGFTINSSWSNSTATVHWALMR